MFKQIACACLAILPFAGWSQLNNPYTINGIGETNHTNNAFFSGYGDASTSYAKPSILNTSNPATYAFLKPQFPIFSAGTGTRFSSLEKDGEVAKSRYTGIPEIALGLSIGKRFGLAFGLRPFANKSYNLTDYTHIGPDSIMHKYIGSGSINQAFGGLSFKVLNFDKVKWSVGANASGVFGQVRDERQAQLMGGSGALAGVQYDNKAVGAFLIDFGTILQANITELDELTFGGYYQPESALRGKTNILLMSTNDLNEPATYSPISQLGEKSVHYIYGAKWKAGVTYSRTFKSGQNKPERKRTSLWTTSIDFTSQDFSANRMYGTDANPTIDQALSFNYFNTYSLNIGTEFTPQVIIEGANIVKLFNRSTYRVGLINRNLPYSINGTQLNEWHASVGMGIPMVIDRRMESSIQFSVGMGQRSAATYKENIFQFNVGIMVAPGFNDRWFIKKKLD